MLVKSVSEVACKCDSPFGCPLPHNTLNINTGFSRTRVSPSKMDCVQVCVNCKDAYGKVCSNPELTHHLHSARDFCCSLRFYLFFIIVLFLGGSLPLQK